MKNDLSVEIFCFIDYRGKEAFKRGNANLQKSYSMNILYFERSELRCFASPILVKSHVWQITMYFRVKVVKFACWAEFYARFSVKVKGVTLCTLRINSFLGSIGLLEYVIRVWNQLHHYCMQISLFELSEIITMEETEQANIRLQHAIVLNQIKCTFSIMFSGV